MDSRREKAPRLDRFYELKITIVWKFAKNKSQLFVFMWFFCIKLIFIF